MRLNVTTVLIFLVLPLIAAAQQRPSYSWVDDDGITHYGDSVPPEYADKPKEVINEHGVKVGHIQGKKTDEQIAAEEAAKELEMQMEFQRRADRALLATYVSVAEIEMHRDRRVELFQAQARVTELYLRNLNRRLNQLKQEAGGYKPYSSDPNAPQIDDNLLDDIDETEKSIARHKQNLKKFQSDEREIIDRFQGDIERFMVLKGLTHTQTAMNSQAVPE